MGIGFNQTLNDNRTSTDKELDGYKTAIDTLQKENEFLKEQVKQFMELMGKNKV